VRGSADGPEETPEDHKAGAAVLVKAIELLEPIPKRTRWRILSALRTYFTPEVAR